MVSAQRDPARPGPDGADHRSGGAQLRHRLRGPLRGGAEQQAAGGLGVGEQEHVQLGERAAVDPRRHPVAVAPGAAGHGARLGELARAREERDGGDVEVDVDTGRRGHLGEVPEQPEAGDVRGARRACRERRPGGGPVRRRHGRHGRGQQPAGRDAPLDRGGGHPDAQRLGQHERVAVAQPGVGQEPVGCHLADDGQAVLGLRVVHAVPADHHEPALRRDVGAARQHLAEHVERQLVAGPGHEVEREQRPAAHRVDVRHRVLGCDPAPGAGVVDDGGEEVGGHHERARSIQPPDGRVVTGLGADEEVRVAGRGQRAQDLRELVRCELAGSTRAVAELGEPAAGHRLGHDPQLRSAGQVASTSHL
jgi:hypothetical protein